MLHSFHENPHMQASYLLTAALLLAATAFAQEPAADVTPPPAKKAPYEVHHLYPLGTCIISGEELGDDAVTFQAGGRTFRTCCPKCEKKIEKSPADYIEKLDAAVIAAQAAHYPLTVCPISGKKLGEKPVEIVIDDTLVRLCCPKCEAKARAEGAKIVQKIHDAAYSEQMTSYPLKTCVVSGEELDKDAVSTLFDTTLVRTCCSKCVAKVEKDPAKYLAKLHPAAAKSGKGSDSDADGKKAGKGGDSGKDSAAGCCSDGACSCCAPKAKAQAKTDAEKPKVN
jgi:hypothetical protein